MKKTILATTILFAGAVGLLAQGVVNFDNGYWNYDNSIELGGTEDYKIYASAGVPVDNATWQAQLWEVGGNVTQPTRLGTPALFDLGIPGYWTGKEVGPLSVAATVATKLQVEILDGSGASLAKGPVFDYTMKASVPPGALDTLMVNFRGFIVPEPSTVALGVLGLGALLLFRRRK
jgi:hypothetical protein